MKQGFDVLVYTSDDPRLGVRLEELGAKSVMPAGSPIGSGQGVLNPNAIRILLELVKVPVIVDAGVGTASDVAFAMELGAEGVLLNTGIASAKEPRAHGRGDARRLPRGAPGVPRGPDSEAPVRERVVARRGHDRGRWRRRRQRRSPSARPSGSYFPEHKIPGTAAEVGAILAATGLAIAPVAAALVRRFFPRRTEVAAPWGLVQVAQVVLVGAVLLAAIAVLKPVPAEGEAPPPSGLRDLVLTAAVLGACCALVALQAARLDPEGVRALGFRHGHTIRAGVAGVIGYGMLLPSILGVGLVWPWFLEAVGANYEPQLVLEKLTHLEPGQRPLALLLGCAVMPFFEEVLFRGYLQPMFVRWLPACTASSRRLSCSPACTGRARSSRSSSSPWCSAG